MPETRLTARKQPLPCVQVHKLESKGINYNDFYNNCVNNKMLESDWFLTAHIREIFWFYFSSIFL